MPTNACQFFYEFENCKTDLKAKEGTVAFIVLMEQYPVLQFKKTKVAVKKVDNKELSIV